MIEKHFYSPAVPGNLLAFIVLERKALHCDFFIKSWRFVLYVNFQTRTVNIL